MKKFLFRLEPVLKHRSDIEEKEILVQSVAQREYNEQLGILENIRRNLNRVRNNVSIGLTVDDCLARTLYIEYLEISLTRQEKVVSKKLQELERKRLAVIEARKDKLILQKLKEKLYTCHIQELNIWEARLTDDQCTALTFRRKGG